MIRRRLVTTFAVVGLVAVASGCSTLGDNNAAATVDGNEVPRDRLERLLRVFTENPELTGIEADPETVSVSSDVARSVLTSLIAEAAGRKFLADNAESITDADRQAALDGVEGSPILDLPDDVLDIIVDLQAGAVARSRVAAPSADELSRSYTADPASTGVVCLRQIVVATESEADDVRDELAAGANFATLAAERSLGPEAASGGAIAGPDGGPCQPLGAAVQSLGPLASAVTDARPGRAAAPAQSPAGWHVIDARAFADVADPIQQLYAQSAGTLLFDGYLLRADVRVDPRYGSWDQIGRNVVSLSS